MGADVWGIWDKTQNLQKENIGLGNERLGCKDGRWVGEKKACHSTEEQFSRQSIVGEEWKSKLMAKSFLSFVEGMRLCSSELSGKLDQIS